MMSPGLQGEVAWQVNEKWLAKISFLDGSPRALLVQAAMALNPMIFAPGDNAPCGFLYLINRGVALYRGALLVKGQTWGHDFILLTPLFRNQYQARALNYVEVFFLARDDLIEAAARFPLAYYRIRWCAVRLALVREAKRMANQMLMQKLQRSLG